MRIVAIASNIVLVAFTCFVLLTEGVSREAPYLVLTLLLLLVPILSSVVLLRTQVAGEGRDGRDERFSVNTVADRLAVFCNLLLLGFSCWSFVAQYPHPKEEGAIAAASLVVFTLLVIFTPIVTVLALLGGMRRKKREQQKPIAQAQ